MWWVKMESAVVVTPMYGYGGIAYMWCATMMVTEPSMARLIPN